MNIFKKIFSIIAAVILFGKCYMIGYAGAEEAPRDIKLTCETKYIDINEIPEDRMVKLAVSIDNNPGVEVLSVLIELDTRLGYDKYKLAGILSDEIGNINFHYTPEIINQMQYDIFPGATEKITNNGAMMNLRVILPDTIKIGDFFNVKILPESSKYATYFFIDEESMYDANYFSELNSGGIHITGDQPVQEPETIPVEQNNVNHSDENTNNEHETSENNNNSEVNNQKISNEVTTVSSLVTTSTVPSSKISITTKPQTNTVTTITTKNTKPVTMVTTEQDKINSDEKTENKKGVNIIWLVISAVLIISIGGSVLILIKRGKNDR